MPPLSMAFFDVKAFTPKIIKDLFLKALSLKVWKSESCSNGFLQKEMAEAFSLSLHEHFARKENHSIESLYQGFDVKIEYLHWTFCSWYDCDLVKGWVSALVTRIWTSTSSSREGVVQPSPAAAHWWVESGAGCCRHLSHATNLYLHSAM